MASTQIRIEPPFGPTDRPRDPGVPFSARLKRWTVRLAVALGAAVLLLVLPFFVLVRSALWLQARGMGTAWLPLAGGVAVTALLLVAYAFVTARALNGTWSLPRYVKRVLLAVTGAFALHGVLYLSASNAKSESVRDGYREVHPVIRMATATLVLVDRGLVVTDATRTVEDYRRMGLPRNEASLHFVQPSGWVHAVDLRTLGRARWKNGMMAVYFWAMGFETIRHRGTADHLHVSLPPIGA
ncbi:MAG: hypothetical protein OEO23_02070 [Gemmatimonadota bacterium]|nr:hypothetical protein [Gemmatimonadota bacterium]